MTSTILRINLGKRWFHVVSRDGAGHVTVLYAASSTERSSRPVFIDHPASLIGMEMRPQHLARRSQAMEHTV